MFSFWVTEQKLIAKGFNVAELDDFTNERRKPILNQLSSHGQHFQVRMIHINLRKEIKNNK